MAGPKSKVAIFGLEGLMNKILNVANMPKAEAQLLGDDVVKEIRKQLARGISPIQGNGRFPAYKGAQQKNSLQKDAKAQTNVAKLREARFGTKDAVAQRFRTRAALSRDQARQVNGYPYNVQKDYPGKKARPVNLYLSGDFWAKLKARVVRQGEQYVIKMGFFDKLSILKEQGHREGANGQEKRPIIPDSTQGEKFSDVIRILIERRYAYWAKKAAKKK